jgi:hypothetical protein
MSLPKQLTVDAWDVELHGCGNNLEFQCTAVQQTKTGKQHRTKLRIKVCRDAIKQLAQQIAAMQERDRARIAEETARLSREIAPLVPGSSRG